jgi:4-carboxymuconolactone decarboxylase
MRLPLLKPAEMTPEQAAFYPVLRESIAKTFSGFETETTDGRLIGPYNPWVHFPKFGKPIWDLATGLAINPVLPPRVREVAVLRVAAIFRPAYQIYSHVAVSKTRGLSTETIATIVAGVRPTDLSLDEALAYDTTTALLSPGPLPHINYATVVSRFGEDGFAELLNIVALYCVTAITLNGFDVPVPPGEEHMPATSR